MDLDIEGDYDSELNIEVELQNEGNKIKDVSL